MDQKDSSKLNPFLMVLAFHAPHDPSTPAPQYENHFSNKSVPRTPAFNYVDDIEEQKPWLLRNLPLPLGQDVIDTLDEEFRDRWRSLMSVDDAVNKIMKKLDELMVLENTFVLFTSDHGYHLGTFAMPSGKFLPYETGRSKNNDIRL